MQESFYYCNGRLLPAQECALPPADRSYLLGDGLFETILVQACRPVFLAEHLARLSASAAFLGYALPAAEQLADAVSQLINKNSLQEGVLRLTVSPAESKGLLTARNSVLNMTITCRSGPPYSLDLYRRGFRAVIAAATRRNEHSPLARHKTTNFLDNVLARREAVAAGADEALLLNTAGNLCEAAAANLFLVCDGKVLTPPVADGALPGIIRAKILALCPQASFPGLEHSLSPAILQETDEAFLTNSLLGVMPLVSVDGSPVGDGRPGPVTRHLAAIYEKALLF
ncbi:MAG: Branched-chain-amino-acid aminotransferase [Syntrophomonadaceae bacterium]|nr:Branched-chain-amino-acid aminotransferase [Bacillota bacterium]